MAHFKNPILRGFHPDPSICRVEEDYYMVTSTFEFFPGVPIYHSRNLIDWELINYCLVDDDQLDLTDCASSGGIYAPTLRYHDGVFYMITTNVTHKGNFIVHTKDIYGKWSKPFWVDQKDIDPSLFFDDDGKAYFTGNNSLTPQKQGIVVFEIDPMTGERLSEKKIVTYGTGGKTPGRLPYVQDQWDLLPDAGRGRYRIRPHGNHHARRFPVWAFYRMSAQPDLVP